MLKLDLEKAPEIKLPTSSWIIEKTREFRKNTFLLHIDYTKAFDCVDHKVMRLPAHLTCLLRNLFACQEATELNMEQQTGSKLGKEYVKAIYCHPAYLTSMQSTSCQMLWAG